jgi:hypothetical protein
MHERRNNPALRGGNGRQSAEAMGGIADAVAMRVVFPDIRVA